MQNRGIVTGYFTKPRNLAALSKRRCVSRTGRIPDKLDKPEGACRFAQAEPQLPPATTPVTSDTTILVRLARAPQETAYAAAGRCAIKYTNASPAYLALVFPLHYHTLKLSFIT